MNRLRLPTLLSVTDNASIRHWIKKHLDDQFFIIDASKKKKALEVAKTSALDFIILDADFEDCDVLELCAEMKQILRTLTPILLITGRLKKSFLDAALEAGVTDFLSNQLSLEELEARIAVIRKTHSLREKTQEASIALPKPIEELPSSRLKNRVRIQKEALKIVKKGKKETL
jgi:PleD family two-component response regulator